MGRLGTSIFSLSQRTRLVAIFAALLAALFVSLATWLPARLEDQARALVEVRALELARLAAAAAEAALDFDDPVSARRVLGMLEHTRGATYAVLAREDGSDLAAWGAAPPDGRLASVGGDDIAYRGGALNLRVALSTRMDRHGALLVGFRLDDLEARRRETRHFVTAATAVVFAAGLLATFLIGTLLARPLLGIARVARRIAGGDLAAAADLPLDRGDEAGAVARALAHMLDRLYQQKATIEALAAGLEQRVAERTTQLERTNGELSDRLAELRSTQEQLIHADRRVSIGRLAAGVAHEINNPLAFMKANLEYATQALPTIASMLRGHPETATLERRMSELRDAITESHQGADRVHHIVRGLKAFARTDDDQRTPVSVADALAAAIDMSEHQIKHRARLLHEISEVPRVEGNQVRLTQVLLNLLLNAAQAIPEGTRNGRIRVTIRTDARGWVVAEVQDNGVGIHKSHLPHIFDPFFTTKPVGSGTGLGLSISQGIVLSMGGEISVESEVGVGTTFRVALAPARAQAEPPAPAVAAAGPGDAPITHVRLLVVDDEPLVGAAVRRALEQEHHVMVATSGRDALDLIRGGAQFDHILCDVMMPEMTGIDFHAELARVAPHQAAAVTFMTGGPFTDHASAFMERYSGVWLEKPLDLEKLRRIVDART